MLGKTCQNQIYQGRDPLRSGKGNSQCEGDPTRPVFPDYPARHPLQASRPVRHFASLENKQTQTGPLAVLRTEFLNVNFRQYVLQISAFPETKAGLGTGQKRVL